MQLSRFRITLKVLLGYVALAVLAIATGWYLYSEIVRYMSLQRESLSNQNKVFRVSELLSELYKNESYARIAVRSELPENFEIFLIRNENLVGKIDSLKEVIPDTKQAALIDSTKTLLQKKADNYRELRAIYTNNNTDAYLKSAIEKLADIETALGKVNVEDFRKNPEKLSLRERALMSEIVNLLNKNRPPKETRKLDEKTIDSIVVTTKLLLAKVKADAATQQRIIAGAENALWENDNIISQQIRQILTNIESEVYENYTQLAQERDRLLTRNSTLLLMTAVVGILIALLFSFLILNDFFRSQKLRKELEKANELTSSLLRNREQLLSTVSHDLRSPLSSLLGYTTMIKQTSLDKKQLYYLENIDQSAQYVNRLANDLLDFAKLETKKIEVVSTPFILRNTLTEVIDSLKPSLGEKPITMTLTVDDELETALLGDSFRIKQIMTNLVGNSCKFTEAGSIEVRAILENKTGENALISITVEDTGIGIEKNKQIEIFNEFTQGSSNIEKKYGGAGLGLTISKKLALLMGGDLTLVRKKTQGSIFKLSLSLKPVKKENQHVQKQALEPKNHNLIIVDDDPSLLRLTSEILKQPSFTVYSFENVRKALEAMKETPYGLVITDIEMPEINGFEFLKILQNQSEYGFKGQPIVAVTGKIDVEKRKFLDAGFSWIVNKPFTPKKLLEVLQYFYPAFVLPEFLDIQKEVSSTSNKNLNLAALKEFLQHDPKAIEEVIELFIKNTESNLMDLETHVQSENHSEIKKIAHKMLPMFRQLGAEVSILILEKLEQENISSDRVIIYLKDLKLEIYQILEFLRVHKT